MKPSEFAEDKSNDKQKSKALKPKTKNSESKKKALISERKRKIEKKIQSSKLATGSLGTYKGETDERDKNAKKPKVKIMPSIKNTKEEKRRNEQMIRKVMGK